MSKKAFLETSIQIRRIWGDPIERIKIQYNLKFFHRMYTSSYCFAEYNRTILKDLKCLLEIVENNSNSSEIVCFADLFRWIKKTKNEGKIYLSQRRFERLLQISASLFEGSNQFFYYRSEFLVTLRQLTHNEAIEMFFCVEINGRNFDIRNQPGCYIEEIECDLIPSNIEPSTQKENHKICEQVSCNRETVKCNLIEFVKQHSTKLSKMEDRLKNTNNSQYKLIAGIFDDLKNPEGDYNFSKLLGRKNCWGLGDFIIVLEAYKIAPIYTRDKIFLVICEPDELYLEE